MGAFRDPEGKVFTLPEDVTDAIWRAATDVDCPLRLPAGKDAVALVK